MEVCPSCGDLVGQLMEDTGWCFKCTSARIPPLERWLHKYANELDRLLADGYSITKAIKTVADQIRPKCRSCGEEMRRAKSTALFCSKYAQCRKARRRLVYYKQDLNMPHDEAVKAVMKTLERREEAA